MLNHTRLILLCSAAGIALAACSDFDLDLRRADNGFSTTDAARQATATRPRPDARGIISYPEYQVVVAQPGDSVSTVAARIGMSEAELARFNALTPDTALRAGEVLALPRMLDGQTGPARGSGIEISTLADTAIARAEGTAAPAAQAPRAPTQPAGQQPVRHRVERGETAFQIARLYNVTPRALADWNGLDPEMRVREGQMLLIPVAAGSGSDTPRPAASEAISQQSVPAPGTGSQTPLPPSASTALPDPAPPAREAAREVEEARPPSPALAEDRSAPARSSFVMPVDGRIIRAYQPGRYEGIGIAASAGTTVRAAAAGRVAAVTEDTTGVKVVAIQHDGGLLTFYAQLDNLTVARGASVTQGQAIGRVRAGDPSFLHFEIRDGMNSVDPMRHLQ